MRITSEVLQRLAEDFIQRRLRSERDILAVFLHGSVLSSEPALGGTADIDLFFVHVNPLLLPREIERITDDIHLDITHYERSVFNRTRKIRLDPWLGPVVNSCRILHDPQHFLNFIQAGVRAQFDRPENVLARSRQHLDQARKTWLDFQKQLPEPGAERFSRYLNAAAGAAQAVALLNGLPLTERRFLLQFIQSAQAVEQPGLLAGLIGLLGGSSFDVERLRAWMPEWKTAYQGLPADNAPVHLQPQRLNYYWRAFEHFMEQDQAKMALWPMLRTWTDLVLEMDRAETREEKALGENARATWLELTAQLELTGEAFEARLAELDSFLDQVEETLESWGAVRGV